MKKKFIVFTLCFTIIFSSINFRKSYADGGLVSLPMLATISSLAIGSGIVLSSNDDLYDLGRMFYDYVKSKNEMTWDVLTATFNSSVSVLNNGLVSVDSKFLNIVKDFFDNSFSHDLGSSGIYHGIPSYSKPFSWDYKNSYIGTLLDRSVIGDGTVNFSVGDYTYQCNGTPYSYKIYYKDKLFSTNGLNFNVSKINSIKYFNVFYDSVSIRFLDNTRTYAPQSTAYPDLAYNGGIGYSGGYTWDNVENKKENESVTLPIPGNLGHLVGQGSKDFWDNTDNLVGNGDISIPSVDNPSIGFDGVISFPNVGDVPEVDVPTDTPFANITDYIIGLVVPSDSYWTDTFSGLHNNFINAFPMVDMSDFNNLIVKGKPFPNIDIKIMGSGGRVVNGDTVNSIVDWLRPIIAGFIFLCLMFFNYRKLYKLIRNSEPFEGIGKVENHAN